MPYCSDCGTELDPSDTFCASCGTEIQDTTPLDAEQGLENDHVEASMTDNAYLSRATSWPVAITAAVMAIITGFFAAWSTANLGISAPAFFIVAALSAIYLRNKRIPSEVLGSGFYITALLMVLTPIVFYLPKVLATTDAETASGTGTFLGSLFGMVIYGFVFLLVALVTAAVGYYFKRRTRTKLDAT